MVHACQWFVHKGALSKGMCNYRRVPIYAPPPLNRSGTIKNRYLIGFSHYGGKDVLYSCTGTMVRHYIDN
jgi:hypothetical protein